MMWVHTFRQHFCMQAEKQVRQEADAAAAAAQEAAHAKLQQQTTEAEHLQQANRQLTSELQNAQVRSSRTSNLGMLCLSMTRTRLTSPVLLTVIVFCLQQLLPFFEAVTATFSQQHRPARLRHCHCQLVACKGCSLYLLLHRCLRAVLTQAKVDTARRDADESLAASQQLQAQVSLLEAERSQHMPADSSPSTPVQQVWGLTGV